MIEAAASGRARCRGCGSAIAKGEMRFGEHLPNPFADDGDMVLWFHLRCAAHRRPQPLLETLPGHPSLPGADALRADAEFSLSHRRLPRLHGAQRSPSGRASCRHCREPIAAGTWRIAIAFFEDGMFSPGGHLHAQCAAAYFGTDALEARLACCTPSLGAAERAELLAALHAH